MGFRTIKDYILFFRTTSLIWVLVNFLLLFIWITLMWTWGGKGWPILIVLLALSFVHLSNSIQTFLSLRVNLALIWKLFILGLLLYSIFYNIEFSITLFENGGYYPCNLGASCP